MKTPMFDCHVKYNGRIVDFAGWSLPVEYQGLVKEHNAVRNSVGIFDVSHMGEVIVKGKKSFEFIQHIICNDITGMYDGKIIYSPMCYENGGIVDDLLVYKLSDDEYLLVVNASNTDKDFEWFKSNNKFGVSIENVSNKYFQVAVQGPGTQKLLESKFGLQLSDIKFFHFKKMNILGTECIVSRTGYTGEDGFEIYGAWADGAKIMDAIVNAGATPCGLGCRDTLRLEAALSLYGHELNDKTTPLEAGIGMFVKLNKASFIGKDVLVKQKEKGLSKKLVGITLEGRNIPRHGYSVVNEADQVLGEVTSGTLSPTLGVPLGLAYISNNALLSGEKLFVNIRKKLYPVTITKLPFVKKSYY